MTSDPLSCLSGLAGMFGPARPVNAASKLSKAQYDLSQRQVKLFNQLLSAYDPGAAKPAPKTGWALVKEHNDRLDRLMREFDSPPTYIEKHKAEMELCAA